MNLELTATTWLLFIATTFLWAASAWLAGDGTARESFGWRVIPLSLFGFAWLGFGVFFIFRFLILLYDPIYFGATNFPLTKIPAAGLSRSWYCLAIFWVAFCVGFKAMFWWRPTAPNTIIHLEDLSSTRNIPVMDAIAIISTILIIIANNQNFPKSLLTPVGHLSSLYLLPVIMAWLLHYQGQEIGTRRFFYLIPGIISYLFNPYREILFLLMAGLILPAMRMKKAFSLVKITIGVLFFLLAATIMTNTYRDYLWGSSEEYDRGSLSEQWETWKVRPYKSPWVKLGIRFHGFDSVALTLYAVPLYIPFSDRNIVYELLVSGFIPRMILDTKAEKSRSREFSTSIWAIGSRGFIEKRAPAVIAPSMPGDLYSIYGVAGIIGGALLFGLLVSYMEGWVRSTGPATSCILIGFFGVGVAGSLERDFVWATATLIQHLIVFLLSALLLERVNLTASHSRTNISSK
jgi:hypothetical protein